MLFEFPERYLLTYGKTGSTSLRKMCDLALDKDKHPAYPKYVHGSDISVIDVRGFRRNLEQTIHSDKPITMVVRQPEQRVISGLTMIVMEDYVNKMFLPQKLSNVNKYMNDEFYNNLHKLWTDTDYWTLVIDSILRHKFPQVFKLGKVTGLHQSLGSLWEIFENEEIDLDEHFGSLKQNSLFKDMEGEWNWYNWVNYYLDSDIYHLGNWQCYVPLELIDEVVHLNDLNDWCKTQSDVELPKTNTNTGRHVILAEHIYTSDQHKAVVDSVRVACKQIPQWPMFKQLMSPENIRYAEYTQKQLWWKADG